MAVSDDPADVLTTYSLGSCIGLSLYDPVACVGGMIHCMLPLSRLDPAKAKANPCMFTDSGVPALLQEMLNRGARKRNLIAKLAGSAKLLDERGTFKIGERNYTVMRKILWKNDILIAAEEVGGTIARTMILHMEDGRTVLKTGGMERELV